MSNADWVYMQVGATLSVCLTVILFAQNALRGRANDRRRIADLEARVDGLTALIQEAENQDPGIKLFKAGLAAAKRAEKREAK